jgi:hypothetical protein
MLIESSDGAANQVLDGRLLSELGTISTFSVSAIANGVSV